MRQCISQALVLVIAGIVLALAGNAISPRGIPLQTPEARTIGADEWIPLEKAKELWENGAAVFLDAREAKDYAAGHIPNAFNLPVASFETSFEEVAPILTPESLIVIYCDGIECELSHRIKERLEELSFTQVKILFNGWTVWREAGLATEQGSGN